MAKIVIKIEGYAPDQLLSPAETAELLGTSVGTLNFWRAVGAGPAATQVAEWSRCVGYRVRDIEAYIQERKPWSSAKRQVPRRLIE